MTRSVANPVRLVPLALVVCVCALYACTLGYDFVWDDVMFRDDFVNKPLVDNILLAISGNAMRDATYYRPLGMLSVALWLSASVQHAVNVALHALNAVLVFLLAGALMPKVVFESEPGWNAAALGALVFAVHPSNVQAVAWVSGRYDLLMLTCVLLCLLAIVRAPGGMEIKRMVCVFALFFAALCAKEAAVGLFAALPLVLVLARRLRPDLEKEPLLRSIWMWLQVLVLAVFVYVVVRSIAVPGFMSDSVAYSVSPRESLVDKVNIVALATKEFMRVVMGDGGTLCAGADSLATKPLVLFGSHVGSCHLDPGLMGSPLVRTFRYDVGSGVLPIVFVVVITVAGLAMWASKGSNAALVALTSLAMAWPALRVLGFPNAESIFSDRYAYAPVALLAATWAAVAGVSLEQLKNNGDEGGLSLAPLRFVLVAAAALALVVTFPGIRHWENNATLWEFAHKKSPDSELGWLYYIRYSLAGRGNWGKANEELRGFREKYATPIKITPYNSDEILVWVMIYLNAGNQKEAVDLAADVARSGLLLKDGNASLVFARAIDVLRKESADESAKHKN